MLVDAGSARPGSAESGEGCPMPLLPPWMPGSYLLAGFVATRLEDSRDGVGIADGTQVFLTGGLQTGAAKAVGLWRQATCVGSPAGRVPPTTGLPAHQGCSRGLGRCRGQVRQHLLHLGQFLGADVIRVWCPGGGVRPELSPIPCGHTMSSPTPPRTQPWIHSQLCREKRFRSGAGRAAPGVGGSGCPRR